MTPWPELIACPRCKARKRSWCKKLTPLHPGIGYCVERLRAAAHLDPKRKAKT